MTYPRFLSCRDLLVWTCAVALLAVLASRVPHIPSRDLTWNGNGPPQMTAKILAKDFFLLLTPAPILSATKISIRLPYATEDSKAPVVFLDQRLHSRPPPVA